MEELDPRRWARAIHPWSRGPRAACRLLQSKRIASTTARSIEPRTPRLSRLKRSSRCGWQEPLSRHSQPRFHGPGTAMVSHARLLSAAIARGESFTPTRSARAPPVAILLPPEAGEASAEDDPLREGHPQAHRAKPRSRRNNALKGRFTRSPAKGSALRRARGAFHRQAHPRKGVPMPLPDVCFQRTGRAESERLFIHRAPPLP